MTVRAPVASLPLRCLLSLYYSFIASEFIIHYITLYYVIPGYIFLELEQQIKKPLTFSEGELKAEMIDPRLHSIPGINEINHMNSNFAFSLVHA